MQVGRPVAGAPVTARGVPTLVFVSRRHCGASRRMESLVAWIKVTQKRRLHVVTVDADRSPELARLLEVSVTPTLILVEGGSVVGRLEGRATGRQIDALVRPHLREELAMTANDDRLDTDDSAASPEVDLEDAPDDEDRQPGSDDEEKQDNYANADDRASA